MDDTLPPQIDEIIAAFDFARVHEYHIVKSKLKNPPDLIPDETILRAAAHELLEAAWTKKALAGPLYGMYARVIQVQLHGVRLELLYIPL